MSFDKIIQDIADKQIEKALKDVEFKDGKDGKDGIVNYKLVDEKISKALIPINKKYDDMLVVLNQLKDQNGGGGTAPDPEPEVFAFPTAYGAGAYSTGGRRGTVSIVTNLNDSGPGSLRSFSNISNTIIIFNISGVIQLTSALWMEGSNVTIAGQTAPKGGITIEGSEVVFQNNKNLICRYIRFRGGYHNPNKDSAAGYNWADVIFDHCSFSFGIDEALEISADPGISGNGGVTIQNCLIAESRVGVYTGVSPENFGTLSMITNVFYNITHRLPNIAANSRYDVINNYAHNTTWRLIRGNGSYSLNQLNNLYDFGDNSVSDRTLNMHGCESKFGLPSIYTVGNTIIGTESTGPSTPTNSINEMNANNTLMWKYFYDNDECGFGMKLEGDQLEDDYFTASVFPLLGKAPMIYNALELKTKIVADAGASKGLNADGSVFDNNDVLDAEWKYNIMNGIYIPKMDISQYATPPVVSVSRPSDFYISNPYIPEEWFIANVPAGQDHNDIAPSGYTWIEEYLNQVDQ